MFLSACFSCGELSTWTVEAVMSQSLSEQNRSLQVPIKSDWNRLNRCIKRAGDNQLHKDRKFLQHEKQNGIINFCWVLVLQTLHCAEKTPSTLTLGFYSYCIFTASCSCSSQTGMLIVLKCCTAFIYFNSDFSLLQPPPPVKSQSFIRNEEHWVLLRGHTRCSYRTDLCLGALSKVHCGSRSGCEIDQPSASLRGWVLKLQ